ncbi:hypothetical protein MPSEU_000880400 [Mayamaea pseudoterrestris]|nr:hypothetical protein MPSEU_000880400 [Mayamaea pseudoterrestris]
MIAARIGILLILLLPSLVTAVSSPIRIGNKDDKHKLATASFFETEDSIAALHEGFAALDYHSSFSMSMWNRNKNTALVPNLTKNDKAPLNMSLVSDEPTISPVSTSASNHDDAESIDKSAALPVASSAIVDGQDLNKSKALTANQQILVGVMVAVAAATLVGAFAYQQYKSQKYSEAARSGMLEEAELDGEEGGIDGSEQQTARRVGNQSLIDGMDSDIEV